MGLTLNVLTYVTLVVAVGLLVDFLVSAFPTFISTFAVVESRISRFAAYLDAHSAAVLRIQEGDPGRESYRNT